jgi:hypothetical protein
MTITNRRGWLSDRQIYVGLLPAVATDFSNGVLGGLILMKESGHVGAVIERCWADPLRYGSHQVDNILYTVYHHHGRSTNMHPKYTSAVSSSTQHPH